MPWQAKITIIATILDVAFHEAEFVSGSGVYGF